MDFLKNLCETGGNALEVYVAAHGPCEVSFANDDAENIGRAENAAEFLENLSQSNPKYENVFDGFDDYNPDVGGRVFVKSNADCAGIYLDNPHEFKMALEFLKNVDAFALAAEDNPDGGSVLTLDWRVEDVKF